VLFRRAGYFCKKELRVTKMSKTCLNSMKVHFGFHAWALFFEKSIKIPGPVNIQFLTEQTTGFK
jgi:hypothetical protein